MIRVRNKMGGEIRDVDENSTEWDELRQQVTPDGFPKWEQTGAHHAEALRERAENGELRPEDLGTEHAEELREAAAVRAADIKFLGPNDHRELFEQEKDAGLDDFDQKVKENERLHGEDHGAAVLEKAAEHVSSRRRRRGGSASKASSSSGSSSSGSDEGSDGGGDS